MWPQYFYLINTYIVHLKLSWLKYIYLINQVQSMSPTVPRVHTSIKDLFWTAYIYIEAYIGLRASCVMNIIMKTHRYEYSYQSLPVLTCVHNVTRSQTCQPPLLVQVPICAYCQETCIYLRLWFCYAVHTVIHHIRCFLLAYVRTLVALSVYVSVIHMSECIICMDLQVRSGEG